MKQLLLFAVVLLMLSLFFFTGCKKDGFVAPKKQDSTVTTLTSGKYYYLTTDNNGDLYTLGYGADTIYKFDAVSGKTRFYSLPVTTDHDTVVVNKLECLTSDSSGNIYAVSVNNAGYANVLKIPQSGSASTIFNNIDAKYGSRITNIASSKGNFYFSDGTGIYEITPGGSPVLLATSFSSDFAVDADGNVIYNTYTYANNIGEINLNQVSPQGVKSVLVAGLYNTGTSSAFSDDIATDKFGNIYAGILNNSFTLLKVSSTKKVTTIMTSAFGNVDGPLRTATIGATFSMVADPSGNIYFSQGNASLSVFSLRKITF
ncbi:hypothetical protein SAMN05216490_4493 [Mucilaginibacter mallensis]|uniref:SMP-30/Gluconolactonase/LRE-like region domain-containing protein n=1 Tax=Mucilaginibacter mallensis TaxID=652787 RepID=A0A1H2C063_MUCMA|nr:hypothetical protein [Mucilaginibacter mallensis]SDT63712.1 hypothetical protein SAMN05216490_4493 [Mucilaginibacter mallensis]